MTNPSITIAKKVLLLIAGEQLPYGQLKGEFIKQMIDNGILQVKLQGRSRKYVYSTKPEAIVNYLNSHHGINDLKIYINNLEHGETRAENVIASSNSKLKDQRTFKGFLVNCYHTVHCEINKVPFCIHPQVGTFTYIHDFETFRVPEQTTIIGIENAENFRFIQQQSYLFKATSILFVSRYPQSSDLVNWLKQIPNVYLHFGDFDFEGIRIFRDEYCQYLKDRSSFYIPSNIEEILRNVGNKALYDKQLKTWDNLVLNEEIKELISIFHRYKKCLEQEVFIKFK